MIAVFWFGVAVVTGAGVRWCLDRACDGRAEAQARLGRLGESLSMRLLPPPHPVTVADEDA